MKKFNKITGDIGEEMAAKYLKKNGYKILERNYRLAFGEIDIIAKHKNTIVFVEVKRRLTVDFGRPVEAVNKRKQEKIKLVAFYFMENQIKKRKVKENTPIRFDVIEIIDDEISHIEDAFE